MQTQKSTQTPVERAEKKLQTATEIPSKSEPLSTEWQFAEWRDKLRELRDKSDAAGKVLVDQLDHSARNLERQVKEFEQSASSEVQQIARSTAAFADSTKEKLSEAVDEVSKSMTPVRESASHISEKAKAKSTQIKDGSGDIATGFKRAWQALSGAFAKAYGRLHDEPHVQQKSSISQPNSPR